MNYLKIYCNLIRKAERRIVLEGYVEEHHVFPKSIYGNNKRTVRLTAREHYIAHALLEKIFANRYGQMDNRSIKMTYAFSFMNRYTNQNNYYNSYLYEGCRIRHAKANSLVMKKYYEKNPHPNKGKKLTENHKQNISNSLKGRKLSKEHIEKVKISNSGKTHSEEAKEKIRRARANQIFTEESKNKRKETIKNKIWMHDPINKKDYRINRDNVDEKLSLGLVLGRYYCPNKETRMKLSLATKKQWERQRNNQKCT